MDPLIQKHLSRIEARLAPASYETHRGNLRDFQGWLDDQDGELAELSALDLEDYFLHLKQAGYAPNTITSRYESVRSLFKRMAGRYGVIEETPFEDLERKEFVEKRTRKHDRDEISYVTAEEKEALCEHVPSPKLRNEFIIRLMWQTGIRKIETINIERSDLHRDERRNSSGRARASSRPWAGPVGRFERISVALGMSDWPRSTNSRPIGNGFAQGRLLKLGAFLASYRSMELQLLTAA